MQRGGATQQAGRGLQGRGRQMARGRMLVLLGVLALACASGPKPKAPDESRRTPVNRLIPPELGGGKRGAAGMSLGDGDR